MARVRNKSGLKLATAMLALAAFGEHPLPAHAVDVINADSAAREIIVNADDGESKTLTLAPRQKITGICESCVIVSGRTSAEASKADVVTISGGKASVRSK